MSIQFKTPRIEQEYNQLPLQNKKLYRIINLAAEYMDLEFGKPVMLTEVYRTPEENAALYKESVQPVWRPHTMWMGVDIRSSIYTDFEIQKLLEYLNLFTVFKGQRKTASYHKITGNALHFHVQADKP